MANQSQINDKRFWKKWRESGAVGTIWTARDKRPSKVEVEPTHFRTLGESRYAASRYDALRPVSRFWDFEVKPLALKCSAGYGQILEAERSGDSTEANRILDEMVAEHGKRDLTSVWYIGQMIGKVEHELADGRDPRVAIMQAKGTLTSESFYRNVFEGKETDETRDYRALGEKLDQMIRL